MEDKDTEIRQYKYLDEKYVTLHSNYTIISKLGEGSYGYVYEASSKLDNRRYAIKRIDLNKRKNKGNVMEPQNLVFIDELMNDNYKEKFYYHSWTESNCLFIKMRLMKGNMQHLYGNLDLGNEEIFVDIFLQLSKFLYLMHKSNYVHLDIKPGELSRQRAVLRAAGEEAVHAERL